MMLQQLTTVLKVLLLLCISLCTAYAQNNVGIGTRQPNPNAVLELVAPQGNQGFLVPGLSTQQRTASSFTGNLSGDDNGLFVFDTSEKVFYYWNDNNWVPLLSGNISQILKPGLGININDLSEIVNTGDIDATDDITSSTPASGDLSGTYPAPQVKEGAISTSKLADGAVTSGKVADGTLIEADFFSPGPGKVLTTTGSGQVFWDNQSIFGLSFLAQGRVYVGNSGNRPEAVDLRGVGNILVGNGTTVAPVTVNGDVTLNSAGNVQLVSGTVGTAEIADGSITNTDIAEEAAISGTKISPDFGAQNIQSSGNLNVQNINAGGKATSASTAATDAATTLTTKDYVDTEIAASSQLLEDGNGIADFSYNGKNTASISVNNGTGLDFDGNGALQLADAGVAAAKLNADVAGDGISQQTNGALQLDINGIAREVMNAEDNDLLAIYDASGAAIARMTRENWMKALNAGNITQGTLDLERLPAPGAVSTTYGAAPDFIQSIQVDSKGRVVGVSTGSASDARLKKDIQPLQRSLQNTLKIQGYQYYWKDAGADSLLQLGVIAQELEKVYPELVKTRADGFKSVSYIGLIPVLIEAVKEQQQMIQSLQQQLQVLTSDAHSQQLRELQQENEGMKAELEAIKALLGIDTHASPAVQQPE